MPRVKNAGHELEATRLHAHEVEHVVRDREQVLAAPLDRLHELALIWAEPGRKEHARESDHSVEGRADLVVHHGYDVVLGRGVRDEPRVLDAGLALQREIVEEEIHGDRETDCRDLRIRVLRDCDARRLVPDGRRGHDRKDVFHPGGAARQA